MYEGAGLVNAVLAAFRVVGLVLGRVRSASCRPRAWFWSAGAGVRISRLACARRGGRSGSAAEACIRAGGAHDAIGATARGAQSVLRQPVMVPGHSGRRAPRPVGVQPYAAALPPGAR